MAQDLGPGRSACILAVVVGCFAILWPSIFYPMLKGSIFPSRDDRNEIHRQEQSHYLRPNAMHPAMRDHGQAVPQPHSVPQPSRERRSIPPPVIAAKKPPIPGLRPPLAGGGHVPSQKDNGPVGILMPLYTVGIVIFFVYTITKLVCKKHDKNTPYVHNPEFHRLVPQNKAKESKQSTDVKRSGGISQDPIKLGDIEISLLRKRLVETEATMERIVKQMNLVSQSVINPHNEDSTPDKNSSEKPVKDELKGQSNEKCVEQANTENDLKHSCQEAHDPIQIRETEKSEIGTNGQSWKHSSEELANKRPTHKTNQEETNPSDIALITNEPVNLNMLTADASTRNVVEESSEILETKTSLSTIAKDSNQQEVDRNETNENKIHVDDEDSGNSSDSNESRTSEQDSFENDVSTIKS